MKKGMPAFYWLPRSALFRVGGSYRRALVPGSRDHWGPCWMQAITFIKIS